MIGYAPSLDRKMSVRLAAIAKEKGIASQPEVMGGRTGTNCDEIQISGSGVRTALLSIPIRNMHTAAELCDLADIEATASSWRNILPMEGKPMLELIKELCAIPGVSGREDAVREYIIGKIEGHAEYHVDASAT
mgnify:CR=1 FL=1